MANITIDSQQAADVLLSALGEQLDAAGQHYDLVVIGGSALLVLGLISRPTRDVDLVGLRIDGRLANAEPLPEPLAAARDRVGRDFGLPVDWLNAKPTTLIDFGMPAGFDGRLETRKYGPALTVSFASRYDQIHFKLYALVDQGPGKHEADLRALRPSREELIDAAAWARTHDPSPGFRSVLAEALLHLGVPDADLGP